MIWLTWRQFRGSAAVTVAALVALAAVLAWTGPRLAADHATGITACTASGTASGTASEACGRFFDRLFEDYQAPFLAVTLVLLLLPGLIGLFWGAPMITRELETGTHLLVWNQTITRTRWLAVKLVMIGLAATSAGGLAALAATWWSGPLDRSAPAGWTLMDPVVFGARGVVPMAYAAFAFVLGVTVGLLVRRTLPAMAVTLVLFAAVQVTVPLLVRPHLMPPVSGTFELGPANVTSFGVPAGGSPTVSLEPAVPGHPGSWVLSTRLVDGAGRPVPTNTAGAAVPVSPASGPCAPSARRSPVAGEGSDLDGCLAEINRLGYRQQATYQPFERFWALQWIETGIYALLTLGLAGACLRWVRGRPS
ncbi:transporter [Nonomuraea antimicrobica]|uniref:Transporter n=1 Tax=Nonomuraea antimicrobica TaxID=561173 RepID=A0ABP7DGU3_9ACTN